MELKPCKLCEKSAFLHALKGKRLYCYEIGGTEGDFTYEEVMFVRAVVGKKEVKR